MVCIKANDEIVKVYQRIIAAMRERVEWNGDIIIRKNTMILVGRVRSMYFELAARRVYSDIEELEFDRANAFEMGNNKLITNIINMLLYPFGKWGAIKGLNVEQDYMVLAALFSQIYKEIDVETYFTKTSFKFFINGIQITFEDAMEKCIDYIQKQRDIKREAANPKEDNGKNETEKKTKEDNSRNSTEKDTEDTTGINVEEERKGTGLWHNMKWNSGKFQFNREDVDKKYANSHRIGNNFYMVPYECPDCGEHLHMVVYPQRKENVIDTDDGRVYITRAYTCDNCKKFYTAKPGKLLREGEAYVLDFDNDEYAARDYVLLLGKKGAKTGNCNFNMYEADYEKNVSSLGKRLSERCRKMELLTDEELEQILAQMDEGFFSDYEKERFLAIIEQELEYREKMRNKKMGEFGRRSNEREDDEKESDEVKGDNACDGEVLSEENKEDNTQLNSEQQVVENVAQTTLKEDAYSEDEISEADAASDAFENKKTKSLEKDKNSRNKNKEKSKGKGIFFGRNTKKTENKTLSEPDLKNKDTEEIKNGSEEKSVSVTEKENETIKESHNDNNRENEIKKENDSHGDNETEITEQNQKEENIEDDESAKKEVKEDGKTADNRVSFFDRITDESRTAKYSEIVENIKKVKASNGSEQEKNHYIEVLTKLCKAAAKREIEYMLSHLPGNINFDRYKRTKEKLMTYTQIDVNPYIKIVDTKRDKVEFDELNKLVGSVDRDNRNDLLEMMEKIKNGEYEKRNSDRFVEGLRKRVYAIDEAKLRGICPNPEDITFDEGVKALKEIEKGIFLPELKSNMLQLIDKKLTALKTEECELLVKKLKRDLDGKISDMSKLHFYDIRKMRDEDKGDKETSFVKVAVSTYAYATGTYEYPIVICDSSMFGSGKEGFIITPDHVFYKGLIKSGSIDVKNIDRVFSEKKGLMIEHSSKGSVKMPCTLNKNDEKNMAEVLDGFVDYLKLKPESRSVEYMSKQEHKVKCCYRCGHVFTKGNICPKCGSRFEQ